MKVGDLNVGDLLRFNYEHGAWSCDLGIVMAVDKTEAAEVVVHWNHEEENPCYHDGDEVDEWLRDGLVEVV